MVYPKSEGVTYGSPSDPTHAHTGRRNYDYIWIVLQNDLE